MLTRRHDMALEKEKKKGVIISDESSYHHRVGVGFSHTLSELMVWLHGVHETGRLLSEGTGLGDKCHNESSYRKSFTFVVSQRAAESHWSTADTLTGWWKLLKSFPSSSLRPIHTLTLAETKKKQQGGGGLCSL